jgi:hypothetical protein
LRYHEGSDGIYHWLDGTFDDHNWETVIRSPNPEVAEFSLSGAIFRGELNEGVCPIMILLTDGTTVLSLA